MSQLKLIVASFALVASVPAFADNIVLIGQINQFISGNAGAAELSFVKPGVCSVQISGKQIVLGDGGPALFATVNVGGNNPSTGNFEVLKYTSLASSDSFFQNGTYSTPSFNPSTRTLTVVFTNIKGNSSKLELTKGFDNSIVRVAVTLSKGSTPVQIAACNKN